MGMRMGIPFENSTPTAPWRLSVSRTPILLLFFFCFFSLQFWRSDFISPTWLLHLPQNPWTPPRPPALAATVVIADRHSGLCPRRLVPANPSRQCPGHFTVPSPRVAHPALQSPCVADLMISLLFLSLDDIEHHHGQRAETTMGEIGQNAPACQSVTD